jgi:hypothetical protein
MPRRQRCIFFPATISNPFEFLNYSCYEKPVATRPENMKVLVAMELLDAHLKSRRKNKGLGGIEDAWL